MDKCLCIIIFNYLNVEDLVKIKDIDYVNHPLVWKRRVRYCDVQKLKGLPLQELDLSWMKITDDDLSHIADMPLQILYLSRTRITNASLLHLKEMPLQRLYLSFTNTNKDICKHILPHTQIIY